MNGVRDHFLEPHLHERTAVVCASRLVSIARKTPSAPPTISAFVNAIVGGSPSYAIPAAKMQLAVSCAKQITEHAARRRMTVAELLRREHVEDDLTQMRLTWCGR